ncbi:DUF6168 family protein [Flavobacterium sp.]|uniref:DUF6168 family protein n=1 Tax=Flavobacterium sp. TaxID=239 RepID=UPI00121AA45F|nr:DUF6168 family protein [Flavobacterium sp.]RZJ71995.1 MAG: hypothetical protein EOO49_08170 [Flavobacterium sp.]
MNRTFLIYWIVFFGIAVAGNFIQENLFAEASSHLFFPAWKTYAFHFAASSFLCFMVSLVHKYAYQSTGFAFVGAGLVKMALSVVFLSPLIFSDEMNYVGDIAAFFIPYFVFLTAEVLFAVRMLKSEPSK